MIDNVAVEFAVRKPTAARPNVSATIDSPEVKKLVMHNDMSVLVLFGFSKTPYTEEQIEEFREWPSLGRWNHRKSRFNVIYLYVADRRNMTRACIHKNILET